MNIYLDNAATSRFKPQTVLEALISDIRRSSNSGRSAHSDALAAGMKIEACRNLLSAAFGAAGFDVIFTKNCTEALNLAIFGCIKGGERVVTTQNEHNSVLRPLCELARRKLIFLDIVPRSLGDEGLAEAVSASDVAVIGGMSNVTGAVADLSVALSKKGKAIVIVDGAQSVPLEDVDMRELGIDMLACPGHKGLHGVQGTGFLIRDPNVPLKPLLYGGTGTRSDEEFQPEEAPEAYEAGTLFSGGIAALYAGAKWSFEHVESTRKSFAELTETMVYNLKTMGCTLYCENLKGGIISFNVGDTDSATIANALNDVGVAVRSGLHCAPLVHRRLGTLSQGAVRASLGVETTPQDVLAFSRAMERIVGRYRHKAN